MREPKNYEAPACAEVGGDLWFPERTNKNKAEEMALAKLICKRCPHQSECAEWGIVNETHGIWGGLLVTERHNIRKRRGIKVQGGEQVA